MAKRVLIVDDDFDVRATLADLLDQQGFSVASCANGREALLYLRSGVHPCVILLDLGMPVMDGWAFRAEQLRDPKLASIPVVVMTDPARVRAHPLPGTTLLGKPVDVAALLGAVRRYCA